ncbi:MAG: glycerol-3-phosphate 1-O-acyltransferase PlsY [Planctomycetes bacterium]|nr:glycerol-3-phosphate 1-O-acyltransferase PlsY [Planctomycetota bacterium]
MNDWLIGLAVLSVSYLIGSIPFGLIAGLVLKGVDIRTVGSGNIGATNAARVIGWKWFPLVLVLDALKGFGPTALAGLLNDAGILGYSAILDYVIIAAVGALAGHAFSVYLKFKGGKGVATGLGVMLAITGIPATVVPVPTLCAMGVFMLVLAVFRMISASSVLATASIPFFYWLFTSPDTLQNPWRSRLIFISLACAFVVWKHRGNMRRILQGTEPRVGQKVAGTSDG